MQSTYYGTHRIMISASDMTEAIQKMDISGTILNVAIDPVGLN